MKYRNTKIVSKIPKNQSTPENKKKREQKKKKKRRNRKLSKVIPTTLVRTKIFRMKKQEAGKKLGQKGKWLKEGGRFAFNRVKE